MRHVRKYKPDSEPKRATVQALARAWTTVDAAPILVVTGAGVSRASGLPTFRGAEPGAIWSTEVVQRGTRRFFADSPAESWEWYLTRFDHAADVTCNPVHVALAQLERRHEARGGDFLLVTQNVDGLHSSAGSRALVNVHGRSELVRCATRDCVHAAPRGTIPRSSVDFDAFRLAPTLANIPRCPSCEGLLRPHILWFDERYDEHRDYGIDRALRFAKRAGLVLFAGTSFSVGVTEAILGHALQRGAQVFSIDPSGTTPHHRVAVVSELAEVALPALFAST